MVLNIGDKAPMFALLADSGDTFSLDDFTVRRLVLYFYPKDMTPGCRSDALGFRDHTKDFCNAGVSVVRVSKDRVKCHKPFKAKYNLGFTLTSDKKGKLCQTYGVWQKKKLS